MKWKTNNGKLLVALTDKAAKAGEFNELCEQVETVEKHIALLTQQETLLVKITLPYAENTFSLEREKAVPGEVLPPLIGKGLSILASSDSAEVIVQVLFETESKAATIFKHDILGFTEVNGTPCFLWHKPFGKLSAAQSTSSYITPMITQPKGSKQMWRRVLLDYVALSPPKTLALALSVAAPIAHILKEEQILPEVPFFSLIGESSTGKTTMLLLISLVWGNPAFLIQNFHATSNAFFAMLSQQSGVPFLADEATLSPDFCFNDLLYSLPAGKGKRRCYSSGKLKPILNFSGAIIVTSERSIIERTDERGGQIARIIEFTERWTESAEEAETLKRLCSQNYGWGVEPLINLLLSEGFKNKLIKRFDMYYAALKAKLRKLSGVEYRIVKKMALIMLAAWVAQKAFKIGLHLDSLEKLLLENFIRTTADNDIIDDADALLDLFKNEMQMHKSKYPPEASVNSKNKTFAHGDLWGMTGFYGDTRCLWVLSEHFREVLKKFPKVGARTACKLMEKKGYLVRFYGDRFYKNVPVMGDKPPCYCVLLPDSATFTETVTSIPVAKRSVNTIGKTVAKDPYGNYAVKQAVTEPLKLFGFVRLSAQNTRLVLNSTLAKALKLTLSDKLYIVPVPSCGKLMLSKDRLANDALSISLEGGKGAYWYEGIVAVNLLHLFDKNVPLYERIVFGDISVEDGNMPVATIDLNNDHHTWDGNFNEKEPTTIDDVVNTPTIATYANRKYLISNEEKEE